MRLKPTEFKIRGEIVSEGGAEESSLYEFLVENHEAFKDFFKDDKEEGPPEDEGEEDKFLIPDEDGEVYMVLDERKEAHKGKGIDLEFEEEALSRHALQKALRESKIEGNLELSDFLKEALETPEESIVLPTKDTSFEEYPYSVHPKALEEDRIIEYNPYATAAVKRFKQFSEEVAGLSRSMSVKLRKVLHAQSLGRTVREQTSGKIDRRKLSTLNMPGRTPNKKVFQRNIKGKSQKVAISILLDQSGSMQGSRERCAAKTAIALGDALNTLGGMGVKFEVIGFDNRYEPQGSTDLDEKPWLVKFDRLEPLQIHKYKFFEETWPKVKARLGSFVAHGNNSDPDAVLFAARNLLEVKGVDRRVLLVLSDGAPCCASDLKRTGEYLKSVLLELEGQGIQTIGIGIETQYVKNFYKDWLVVNSVEDLEKEGIQALSNLLIKGRIK